LALPLWRTDEPDFRRRFDVLLGKLSLEEGLTAPGAGAGESPQATVQRIVRDVRERGDAALLDHTERLDRCRLEPGDLRVSPAQIEEAAARCAPELVRAMRIAAERIRVFQDSILVRDPEPLDDGGRRLSVRYQPVDSAGIYIPGGTASLASSVLMTAVPARVAGVERVVMATPPRADGSVSPDRLAAARIAGVHEVYRMGGAQAIAALAYGTETVKPVDFIAGPGNIYVTLAKREVYGRVGIEMLPGPSEVVIIADETARPEHVAADMLAQAEHEPGSSLLLTDDEALALAVRQAVAEQLPQLSRAQAARADLERYGAAIVCRSMDECVELTNALAPEHLQIVARDAAALAERVRHAGAVFLGPWTPVAVGDYIAGPSHVLPTSRTARFSSGLSANDFLKRTSIIRYERAAFIEDAPDIASLANAEGLDAHVASVRLRVDEDD